ncbi:nuclear pore complex protein Nup133-like, partial [Amphibalanus amphitrite]
MYTPQVNAISRESFSARGSPRTSATKSKSAIKSRGLLSSSFSASPGAGLHTSRIIEETQEYSLESLGSPLPVLVTEVLSSSERSGEVSVQVSERGWAWLVCGRRLFVWRYAQSSSEAASRRLALCRELTLPPSDLAHRAELVQVLGGSEVHVPSCLAVSPEGTLRFWPSVIYESSSTESNADLQGQECERLICLGDSSCLLATTTSTLVLVSWPGGALGCRRLAPPAGLLGGIGRRVSSLIWGAMQTAGAEEPLVSLRAAAPEEPDCIGHTVYVMTARHLQRWWVADAEHMDSQLDVERLARDAFVQHLWSADTASEELEVTLRDLWVTNVGIVVLATALSPTQPGTAVFAIGVLEDSVDRLPRQWSRFDVVQYTLPVEQCAGTELRLLAPGERAYIQLRRQILCVNLSCPSEPAETLRLSSPSDQVLGWGLGADSAPLVFTSHHGLLRLNARAPCGATTVADTSTTVPGSMLTMDQSRLNQSLNVSMTQADVDELTSGGPKARLRAACILYCRNELTRCAELVEELFPRRSADGFDSQLDKTVADLSADVINDYPASDPRWAEAMPHDATVSTTNSLILLNQLGDKREAHQLYLAFLRAVGLWDRLTGISREDSAVATTQVLREHHEKILAAMALTNQSAQLGQVVDDAVTRVVEERGEVPQHPLTAQDVFFRHLSAVDDIIGALVGLQEELLATGAPPRDLVQLTSDTNTILVRMLTSVSAAAADLTPEQTPTTGEEGSEWPQQQQCRERQPWGTAGPARELLHRQYQITLKQALPNTETGATRTSLYQQLLELADLLLSGYTVQLESLRGVERYAAVEAEFEKDRYQLIHPLLEAEEYERATSLAEKYLDFRILVEVCEKTNSTERRNKYLTQFADKGFADFLFNWYLDQGRRGQLLSQCRRAELAGFLQEYRGLRWLNELEAGRYGQAGDTLEQCATSETEFLTRKKTYLSLAKLCALAGRQGNELEGRLARLQPEFELTQLQEQLPLSVLE